jgi:fumarate reductase iron-sulfur subunit
MGVCGSCGMMVNGKPKLTCAVPLSDYTSKPIRIEPLQYFPVLRDLIVDISSFLKKLSSVKPWIIRDDEQSQDKGEYVQTPAELDVYKQFSMCINCMLCYSACPVVGLEPEFTGPAAITLAQRYNLDSRDQGAAERLAVLDEHDGMWGCTFVGECTKVCPKNVDPAGAIQLYKKESATEWFKSVLLPWGSK